MRPEPCARAASRTGSDRPEVGKLVRDTGWNGRCLSCSTRCLGDLFDGQSLSPALIRSFARGEAASSWQSAGSIGCSLQDQQFEVVGTRDQNVGWRHVSCGRGKPPPRRSDHQLGLEPRLGMRGFSGMLSRPCVPQRFGLSACDRRSHGHLRGGWVDSSTVDVGWREQSRRPTVGAD
jgi:hypothetical protein